MSKEALTILGQSLNKLAHKDFADKLAKSLSPSSSADLGRTFRKKLNSEVHYITKRATIEFYDEYIKHEQIHMDTFEFNNDIDLLWNAIVSCSTNYYIDKDKIYLVELNKLTSKADRDAILRFILQEPVGSITLSEERFKKLNSISSGFNGVDKLFKSAFALLSKNLPIDSVLVDFIQSGYDIGHYGANISHLTGIFTIGALLNAGRENAQILNEFMQEPDAKKLIEQEYRNILDSTKGKALFKAELFKVLYEHELELIRQVSDTNAYSSLKLNFNAGSADIKKIVKNILIALKSSSVEVGPQNSTLNQSIGREIESMIRSHLPRFYQAIEAAIAYKVSTGSLDLARQRGSASLEDLVVDKIKDTITGKKSKSTKKVVSKSTIKDSSYESLKVDIPKGKNTLNKSIKTVNLKLRSPTGKFTSIINIENLIRKILTETVVKNMERPNLRNQTGRFARSVELVKVTQRGKSIQAFLTYMKYPYQTFEPGFKQGHKGYDPRRLIDQSVREIATKIVKARLQTVFV